MTREYAIRLWGGSPHYTFNGHEVATTVRGSRRWIITLNGDDVVAIQLSHRLAVRR